MEYCCFCSLLTFEKNISEIPSMSNRLDPDQIRQNVWSGLTLLVGKVKVLFGSMLILIRLNCLLKSTIFI